MKKMLVVFLLIAAFGCATPTILLVHPRSGQLIQCAPGGRYAPTLVGQIVTNMEIESCVKQYEALGYIRADKMSPERETIPAITEASRPVAGLNGTFTGEIKGKVRGQGFAMRVTFTLVQKGDQLAGVWNTTSGTSGTMTGTVHESKMAFRAKQVNPCEGDFAGTAVIEDNVVLRGSYAGSDCSGSVAASFLVNRQE